MGAQTPIQRLSDLTPSRAPPFLTFRRSFSHNPTPGSCQMHLGRPAYPLYIQAPTFA
jgi:hypothetical protein